MNWLEKLTSCRAAQNSFSTLEYLPYSSGRPDPMREILRRCLLLFTMIVLQPLPVYDLGAAERTEPIRIGALTDSWGPTPGVVGLRDGLKELGYRENQDFVIGIRFTQGDIAALPQAARELVQQGVDILFTNNPAPAKAAQMATNRIPIVFYGAGDPIGLGLIKSFARPGGNITGVTDLDLELDSKRLEIFKEMMPGLTRVLFPYDKAEPFSVAQAKIYRQTARRLKVMLIEKTVTNETEAQATFNDAKSNEIHGIVVPRSLSFNIPGLAVDATSRQRIPTMFFGPWYVEQGGLASYGPDFYESGRQAARLVDKIIKGTNPREIPVEVNNQIEFVVNLKVATVLGIKIVPEALYRATRVIR
jgi:putative tryptophan/tyrosine transport system substrate-binding protein